MELLVEICLLIQFGCGWCWFSNRSVFLIFLPSRSRNDLFTFLKKWVLVGSTIHTDCLISYSTLRILGLHHFKVNCFGNLVGLDGIHTDWIEDIFYIMKKMIRKYDYNWSGVDNLSGMLVEFWLRYGFSRWDRSRAFLKIFFVL